MNDKKFIILILCLFILNTPIAVAGGYDSLEYETYKIGEDIGQLFGKALFWIILITIIVIIAIIALLRAIFSIGTRVEQLDEINKQLAELNTLNNDIRILLTSIDGALNRRKTNKH